MPIAIALALHFGRYAMARKTRIQAASDPARASRPSSFLQGYKYLHVPCALYFDDYLFLGLRDKGT